MNSDQHLLERLLSDDSFVAWVRNPDSARDAYWQAWQAQDPGRKEVVEEARSILLSISFQEASLSKGEKDHLQERIANSIGVHALPSVAKSASRGLLPVYLRYAAAITVLLTFTYFLLTVFQSNYVTVSTAYGETKSILLPDSSKVTLNANSSLRYPSDWTAQAEREVWLEGEALFKVSKQELEDTHATNQHRKFVVHATKLNVEVLGTEFNVRNRKGQTEVTLREGKVRLLSAIQAAEEVLMQPGDHARLMDDQKIEISRVEGDEYTIWTASRWAFRDTPLEEVAQTITDFYGLEVDITESSLKNRKFSGSPPKDDLSELLKMLSAIFQVPVKQEGNTIHMGH